MMARKNNALVARVELLIRAPQKEIFSAFIKPRKLRKFWLSKASGKLAAGKTIQWHFKVRGAKDSLRVIAFEPNQRLRVRWSDQSETEWTLTPLSKTRTVVTVEQRGFRGAAAAVIEQVAETVQGFAYVLSDLKVLLERKIKSGIVADKAVLIERRLAGKK